MHSSKRKIDELLAQSPVQAFLVSSSLAVAFSAVATAEEDRLTLGRNSQESS
jgi:hypothetical protein